jgi:TPR repeat
MWSTVTFIGVLLVVLLPQALRAQATGCQDFYPDRSVSSEERARTLAENGRACVREGKPEQSIALFSELIGLNPQNATAYLNRGNV